MRKKNEPNGCMTLKIALEGTAISRTIAVPEHMTLADLHCAIQTVMGWDQSHLWAFTDRRDDEGVLYEAPITEDDYSPCSLIKRLKLNPARVSLLKVFPEHGSKLFYEYDFGDGWFHVITRQADPKTPEIACLKAQGPAGLDDIGGAAALYNPSSSFFPAYDLLTAGAPPSAVLESLRKRMLFHRSRKGKSVRLWKRSHAGAKSSTCRSSTATRSQTSKRPAHDDRLRRQARRDGTIRARADRARRSSTAAEGSQQGRREG